MRKFAYAAVAALIALGSSALAQAAEWNVTEEGMSGVKNAQGRWAVKMEGDKLSGTASLQMTNGNPLTYEFTGSAAGGVYTVKMDKRTDDKQGCVWTGHAPSGAEAGAKRLIGEAKCDGGASFLVRTSP